MTLTPLPAGISLDDLSDSIRPGDDLFRYVNGAWLDRTPIPSDRAWYGSTIMLRDEAEKAVRDIVEEARGAEPGTEARKIGDLYASFMDEERVEQLGATPLAGALALAAAVDSIPSLLARAGHAAAPRRRRAVSSRSSTTTRATRPATSCSSSRAASACPTRATSATRDSPTCARLPGPRREDARAGGSRRRRRRAPSASLTSRPRSRRSTGTTSSAATRSRPTTS